MNFTCVTIILILDEIKRNIFKFSYSEQFIFDKC